MEDEVVIDNPIHSGKDFPFFESFQSQEQKEQLIVLPCRDCGGRGAVYVCNIKPACMYVCMYVRTYVGINVCMYP